jgi:N-carbamoylputrescine amidase
MRKVTFAATQMNCDWDVDANIERAAGLVEIAAEQGADVVLIQELFATPYFCKDKKEEYFKFASPYDGNQILAKFSGLAKEHGVVLPVSYFENAGNSFFNSLAMIDADGRILGNYRKSHIPQGPGYEEKYYFSPGDTGFKVWETAYGKFGAAICWDQWFPEAARAMVLQGAEVLFYPTAIGSEPEMPDFDSMGQWRRAMQGHSAANLVPVVASNRIGKEQGEGCSIEFYGSSFVTDQSGELVAAADRDNEAVVIATFDLDAARAARVGWGVFRDRRPDLYKPLLSLDGESR